MNAQGSSRTIRFMLALACVVAISRPSGVSGAGPENPTEVVVRQIMQKYGKVLQGVELPPGQGYGDVIRASYIDLAAPALGAGNSAALGETVDVKAVQLTHRLEIERTDKQKGASSKASASTSATENAGINWLLGLALETGAITQEENKTGVTLWTSPYAFITLATEDTRDVYKRYDLVRRLGLSATFATDNSGEAEDRNFDPSALTEFSAKYVIYGDRSPRSSCFQDRWNNEIRGLVEQRLVADTQLMSDLLDHQELAADVEKAEDALIVRIDEILALPAGTKIDSKEKRKAKVDEAKPKVTAAIEASITKLVDETKPKEWPPEFRARIRADMARFVASRANFAKEDKLLARMLADLKRSPEVTAGYTLHRKKDDADYSEIKLLAEYAYLDPDNGEELLAFVGNASLSLNHHNSSIPGTEKPAEGDQPAQKGKKRETVRDFSVSLSVEKKVPNFLPFRANQAGTDNIILSVSGKFMRLEDEEDEIGVAQAKASFPLATGVDLPVSVTYATRSEYVDEDEVRGNFGISVDTDKLWSLAKLASGS